MTFGKRAINDQPSLLKPGARLQSRMNRGCLPQTHRPVHRAITNALQGISGRASRQGGLKNQCPLSGALTPGWLDKAVIRTTSRLPSNWLGLRLAIGLRRIVTMRLGGDHGLDVERWGLRMRLHPRYKRTCYSRRTCTRQPNVRSWFRKLIRLSVQGGPLFSLI